MRKFVERLSEIIDKIVVLSLWISAAGLVTMTVLIFWQVYGRFVLNDTPTWTETTSILIMGWFLLLGAAAGIREGNHLSFDVLLFLVSDRIRGLFITISDIVIVAFGLGMFAYGIQLADKTWQSTIPNLGISGGFAFLALITGGLLVALYAIERLLRRAVGLQTWHFADKITEED